MDFKSLTNKESFKAILLHHLKNRVKTKYGNTASIKIQESLSKDDSSSSSHIISSVSKDILESPDFTKFMSTFLEDVESLLQDKDAYVPKPDKHCSSSQCSSASSVNASSIDFLSPAQFQNVTQSLANGTNAEKLEALGLLYRLPTLEHLIHHFLWAEVEAGLHNSLSSPVMFLRSQSFRLYVKMLTCAEPKVVLESYQSLIKYFLQVLLPSLNEACVEPTRCRCAVEIIYILNKFLQIISTHWLRYPQSMIENITTQSLSILSNSCKSEVFPVWMCNALCDSEAKWLKSILHGHISRASLVNALRENFHILSFVVGLCDKFYLDENCLSPPKTCCQMMYLVNEITHSVCFLAHLFEYSEGRKIFDRVSDNEVTLYWTTVLGTVMNCVCKLCDIACFDCCVTACDVVSKKWLYFWKTEYEDTTIECLVKLLTIFDSDKYTSLNALYFLIRCFCESYGGMSNIVHSSEFQSQIEGFLFKLLDQCSELAIDDVYAAVHVINSSLVLVKEVCLSPSTLFLNCDFIHILSKWLLRVKELMNPHFINSQSYLFQKEKEKIIKETNQNILDVSISFLHKPIRSSLFSDSSTYEVGLNILLEKILLDTNSNSAVCPIDISILSRSLNCSTGSQFALSQSFVFRLSSIIWQSKDKKNFMDDPQSLKFILESLLVSIFNDLPSSEDTDTTEPYIFKHVLLLPNSSTLVESEDYIILVLRIISLLCSSVHSLCLLESEFKLSELLLERQLQHLMVDDKYLIDPISVLQNHILVKSYTLGGPGERRLPCEMLNDVNEGYDWPFVVEHPVPEIYLPTIHTVTEIDANLLNVEPQIEELKCAFLSSLKTSEKLSPSLMFHLLENSISALQPDIDYLKITDFIALDASDCTLHNTELAGLEMVKRYGVHLNLIPPSNDEEVDRLLKASKNLLKSTDNKLDVFVCSVYLICKGNIDIAWSFLQNFSKCSSSLFIWKKYQVHVSRNYSIKQVPLQSVIYELCDIIVKKALPQLFSALQFSGILPSALFDHWTSQCYWNYLDFSEISHFILLNVLSSGEHTLYFFVAVLKHLGQFILENAHNCELFSMLLKCPIQDFTVGKYIDYMMELGDRFHLLISNEMKNILL